MSNDQARILYGYESGQRDRPAVEHWTPTSYKTMLDGKVLGKYTGANPWGFTPFAYAPRVRTDNWWGDPLTPDIIPIQDELNDRIADIGEALNYNAHPTRWGVNLPRSFKRENFPLGPNALWDLGRQVGSMPPAQVGMLEAKNPIPDQAFKHLLSVGTGPHFIILRSRLCWGRMLAALWRYPEIRMWSMSSTCAARGPSIQRPQPHGVDVA
jgi:hypothetical protein